MQKVMFIASKNGGVGKTDLFSLKFTENDIYLINVKTISKTLTELLNAFKILGLLINLPFQMHTSNKFKKFNKMSFFELDDYVASDKKSYKYSFKEIQKLEYSKFFIDEDNSSTPSYKFKFIDNSEMEFSFKPTIENGDLYTISLIKAENSKVSLKEVRKV
jgi:hypothetical protein